MRLGALTLTYFTSSANKMTPDTRGVAALVPVKFLTHSLSGHVDTLSIENNDFPYLVS